MSANVSEIASPNTSSVSNLKTARLMRSSSSITPDSTVGEPAPTCFSSALSWVSAGFAWLSHPFDSKIQKHDSVSLFMQELGPSSTSSFHCAPSEPRSLQDDVGDERTHEAGVGVVRRDEVEGERHVSFLRNSEENSCNSIATCNQTVSTITPAVVSARYDRVDLDVVDSASSASVGSTQELQNSTEIERARQDQRPVSPTLNQASRSRGRGAILTGLVFWERNRLDRANAASASFGSLTNSSLPQSQLQIYQVTNNSVIAHVKEVSHRRRIERAMRREERRMQRRQNALAEAPASS